MKHNLKILAQYLPWLILLFVIDGFSALLLWLADVRAFAALFAAILLAGLLLFVCICIVELSREKKRRAEFLAFLENPDACHEERLLKTVNASQADAVCLLSAALRKKQDDCHRVQTKLADYEKYVEAWAHEIKTPISLLTFLLDNRRDELPQSVSFKLDYIRNRTQGFIDQMLFYARLNGTQKDYLFEHLCLPDCLEEVLEDYRPLIDEKRIRIERRIPESASVYTDRRGIRFLLGQLVGNAVKYSDSDPVILFDFKRQNGRDVLSVRDNGIGIKECDLPYIFMEGFTGDSGENRKKATGMGLYLAKEMAGDLGIELSVESKWGKGTEAKAGFAVVERSADG